VQEGQALVPAGGSARPTGLLVSTPDGKRYLVYNNRRYQVTQPNQVLAAFGWSATPVLPVSPALINALPAGPDLKPLPIARRGEKSSVLPGSRVGQVYQLTNGSSTGQYSVVLADGLADITDAQAALLRLDPETPAGTNGRATDLSPADYGPALRSKTGLAAAPPFAAAPDVRSATGSVCIAISEAEGVNKVVIDPRVSDVTGAVTPARTTNGGILADRIVIPPGRGALVEAVTAPGAPGGALSIISDRGIRYPLASRDLVAKLGYGGVTPMAMPAELVALLPAGAALDPADARQGAGS
jgi:type VII secretion protein EccB